MTDKLASLKRNSTKQALITAYQAYERKEPGSMDRLLQLVRNFAFSKVRHLEYEPDFIQMGSAETADDWAQEVLIKTWQGLANNSFRGTPEQFYAWVHKIAYRQSADAFNGLLKEKKTKVQMFTSNEEADERGRTEKFTEENPLIHADSGGYAWSKPIPAHVQGVDLQICKLLMTEVQDQKKNGDYFMRGRNYAEVGFILNMTSDAVQMRLKKLRDRNLEGCKTADEFKAKKKAEREAKRLEAELEAKNRVSIGLAKIRSSKP